MPKQRRANIESEQRLLTKKVEDLRSLLQCLYRKAFTNSDDNFQAVARKHCVDHLLTKSFDIEQIWTQIDKFNDVSINSSFEKLPKYIARNDSAIPTFGLTSLSDLSESDSEAHSVVSDASEPSNVNVPVLTAGKVRPVDFLNIKEMKKFASKYENHLSDLDSDEEAALFDDCNMVEAKNDVMYSEFFGVTKSCPESSNKIPERNSNAASGDESSYSDDADTQQNFSHANNADAFDSDDDDEDDDNLIMSKYTVEQQRLREKIKKYEEDNLTMRMNKPWELGGEVAAKERPSNSMLESHVEMTQSARLPPSITEEFTAKLEELVKQRITDHVFDDVARKVKPSNAAAKYKRQIELDFEKPKASLAEVYEAEFLSQQQKDRLDAEDPNKREISTLMRSLFAKLDALCNHQFQIKPPAAKLQSRSNSTAARLEDRQPVSVSDAQTLAPEEYAKPQRHELEAKEERSTTDKKREQRKRKVVQHSRFVRRERKENERLTNSLQNNDGTAALSKEEAIKRLKRQGGVKMMKPTASKSEHGHSSLSSSKEFFSQLQDTTSSKTTLNSRKRQSTTKPSSGKQFKL